MKKYTFGVQEEDEVIVDNRDPDTTWIILPDDIILEVTRQDLLDLLENMDQ